MISYGCVLSIVYCMCKWFSLGLRFTMTFSSLMGSSIEQRMKLKVGLFVEQRTNLKANSIHLGHVGPNVFSVFQMKNIFGVL